MATVFCKWMGMKQLRRLRIGTSGDQMVVWLGVWLPDASMASAEHHPASWGWQIISPIMHSAHSWMEESQKKVLDEGVCGCWSRSAAVNLAPAPSSTGPSPWKEPLIQSSVPQKSVQNVHFLTHRNSLLRLIELLWEPDQFGDEQCMRSDNQAGAAVPWVPSVWAFLCSADDAERGARTKRQTFVVR